MTYRVYDTRHARFNSPDPGPLQPGLSAYLYGAQGPLGLIDPSGLISQSANNAPSSPLLATAANGWSTFWGQAGNFLWNFFSNVISPANSPVDLSTAVDVTRTEAEIETQRIKYYREARESIASDLLYYLDDGYPVDEAVYFAVQPAASVADFININRLKKLAQSYKNREISPEQLKSEILNGTY
jgi:hypothetical protein